ncbi:hypothetical protein J3R83DRAFT_3961 [Lanmaoa asiatica]|nr:hypothetical protein J3R83DRAFT_3961 [Lanmaoa asiatica]
MREQLAASASKTTAAQNNWHEGLREEKSAITKSARCLERTTTFFNLPVFQSTNKDATPATTHATAAANIAGEDVADVDESLEHLFMLQNAKRAAATTSLIDIKDIQDITEYVKESNEHAKSATKWKHNVLDEVSEAETDHDKPMAIEPEGNGMEMVPVPATRSPVVLQTTMAVVEAPPLKKLKTERLDNGTPIKAIKTKCAESSLRPSTAEANVGHADASQPHKSVTSRGKQKKVNLPPLLQEDIQDKSTKVVLPSLVLWYGDQENVWSYSKEELTHMLISIICIMYPTFDEFDKVGYGSTIYALATHRLSRWRNTCSSTAVNLIVKFLRENPIKGLTSCETATFLLDNRAFAYEDFDSSDSTKAFCSFFVLSLLGAHLQQISGWVDVPCLDLRAKADYGVKGVLALSTATLEHALKCAVDGKLDKELGITATESDQDEEASTSTDEGTVATASANKGKHLGLKNSNLKAKTPRQLNKATGKESTSCNAFSQQNWGGQMAAYYKSIAACNADELNNIIASVLRLMATTQDNRMTLEPSTFIQPELDPRAQMCKPPIASFVYIEWIVA